MRSSRRDFLKAGAATAGAGVAGTAFAGTTVIDEMRRRLGYLSSPGGTPPDILSQPSPPVDPWQVMNLEDLKPPGARPLFEMEKLSDFGSREAWFEEFSRRFKEAAGHLRMTGFLVPEGADWTVAGDEVRDGRVRIDIGEPPVPEAHQRFFEFAPEKFYINREMEFRWSFHNQYGDDCHCWGYHCIYFDSITGEYMATRPSTPGPTFHARYGEPIMTRRINDLPEIGHGPGHSRIRFALPSTSSHLHNAHTASESDGYPNDWLNPGEYWDHHYCNFPSGHDEREKLTTLWYHDHRMDFTASNVYAGLNGFYLFFDETADQASGIGDLDDETIGWNLPSGDYDIPLIFHDILFAQEIDVKTESGEGKYPRKVSRDQSTRWSFESPQDWTTISDTARGTLLADGTRKAITHAGFNTIPADDKGVEAGRYSPSPQMIFDGFNTEGIIGDRWTVNRRIQPTLKVEPR